jgi:hypothetical protein
MRKITGLILLAVVVLASCRPETDFNIGQPQNRLTQLAGTWKLQSVVQTDLLAQSNNDIDPSRPDINLISLDITDVAPFTDMTVSLTNDGTNLPATFSINYGAAPRIFKHTTGNYRVDNNFAPGQVRFISGTDTVRTLLSNLNNLAEGKMTLQLIKRQGIKPVIRYDYNFIKN